MKKGLTFLLAGAMSIGLLVGCGQGGQPQSTAESTPESAGAVSASQAQAGNKSYRYAAHPFVPSRASRMKSSPPPGTAQADAHRRTGQARL